MDGQPHNYEINLKKDDLFINLSSDDVYFISKQMDKWFKILLDDSYIPVSAPIRPPAPPAYEQPAPMHPVYEQPPAPPQPIYEQPAPQPPIYAAPPPPEAPVNLPPVYAQQPQMPQPLVQSPALAEFYQPQFQQAAAPQPVPQALLQQPQPQPMPEVHLPMNQPVAYAQPQPAAYPEYAPAQAAPQPQPMPEPRHAPAPIPIARPLPPLEEVRLQEMSAQLDEAVQDDFEAVMDTLMKDLESEDGPVSAPTAVAIRPGNGRPANLENIASLSDLCDRSHAGSSEDYLLLSAYYLAAFEQVPQFSLKRVNSALVKSGLTPVNHSVLESTLSRGYLSMVPDLTGLADVTEYILTGDGQQAAIRLL